MLLLSHVRSSLLCRPYLDSFLMKETGLGSFSFTNVSLHHFENIVPVKIT